MTPFGVRQLQIAATMAHSMPGVTIRLRRGSDTLLFAGDSQHGRDARWISACALRQSVANLLHASGPDRRVSFLHLPEGEDPAIEWVAGEHSRLHPGGVVTAFVHGRVIHAFATSLNSVRVRAAVSARTAHLGVEGFTCITTAQRVQLHSDTGLLTTLVSIEQGTSEDHDLHDQAVTVLNSVMARCAAEEADGDLRVLASLTA
jgi:hypothetical protein